MKQVIILTIALMLSLAATRIVSEDDGRKQRYARVTANYNKCVEVVHADEGNSVADARCRHWAIMTTD